MQTPPSRPLSSESASRRTFLGTAIASGISAASTQANAASTSKRSSRVLGANDRIRVASIGVGGKGAGHLRMLAERATKRGDVQVAAVCDVYARRRAYARKTASLAETDVYLDYLELLQRDDIDAVFIATPDHWHAPIATHAIAAGKDVYLEKPYTLTVEEAQALTAAVKQGKRVMQVGSQHLSDPRYHVARKLIEAGEIGTPLWAQSSYSRNSKVGEWNYYVDEEASPQTIDWQRWLGSAPHRPFSAERYFRWRKYWDYSGGIATDLFYHRLGPILFAMGAQFPTRISASGGIYRFRDREVPDTYSTTVEYPAFTITLSSSMANAAGNHFFSQAIYGHKGTLSFEREGVRVIPEPLFAAKDDTLAKAGRLHGADLSRNIVDIHHDDFFTCMRTRKQPVLNEDLALQIMTAIGLGVRSYREGRLYAYDPSAQRILTEAPARQGYEGDGANHPEGYRPRV